MVAATSDTAQWAQQHQVCHDGQMAGTFAHDERQALASTLQKVGGQAPTTNPEWNTHDLAAHLVARERRLDGGPGLIFPGSPLASWTEQVRQHYRARPYDELVTQFRLGPPRWSPLGWPAVQEQANTAEFFLHHEEVLREGRNHLPRRVLSAQDQRSLWRALVKMAPLLLRTSPVGVIAVCPQGERRHLRKQDQNVVVTGESAEILLALSGRRPWATIDVGGSPEAVAAFNDHHLSM